LPELKLTADLSADPEERKEQRVKAIDIALRTAGGDAGFRLAMILGEAYRKYDELAQWIADEIARDEAKAPGLVALARQLTAPGHMGVVLIQKRAPADVVEDQDILLRRAVKAIPNPKLIEHKE